MSNIRWSVVVPESIDCDPRAYLARSSAMRRRLSRAVVQLESGKGKARRLIKR